MVSLLTILCHFYLFLVIVLPEYWIHLLGKLKRWNKGERGREKGENNLLFGVKIRVTSQPVFCVTSLVTGDVSGER